MPKALVTYVRYIESMNTWLGKILSFCIFLLIGILVIEGISRYVFNAPTPWSIELSQFTLGTYFLIGGGYALLRGAHVKMDVLSSRWSPKTKAIVDLATFSLLAVYLIVVILGGINNAAYALRFDQHSGTLWGPPLAPIKIIITVGAGLLLLQAVAFFIRDLSIVFKGKDLKGKDLV